MKKFSIGLLLQMMFAFELTGFVLPNVLAAPICEYWVGKVVSIQGKVCIRRKSVTYWTPAKTNDILCPGDMIHTHERSRAVIILHNEGVLRLDEKTSIIIPAPEKEPISVIDMIIGNINFFSRSPRGLKVLTPFVNAFVEGTEFYVGVESDRTLLSIFEGQLAVKNDVGRLILSKGESALAQAGKAPTPIMVVNPRDAIQWALYYPPVMYYRPSDFSSKVGWQEMVRRSIEFYWNGDLASAFSSLEEVSADIQDPRFFIYRAGLLIAVGCVNDAGVDIEKALNLDPSNSEAFALQSIIAVAQNKKVMALDLAMKAVKLAPESPCAKVALSYAQQADFDLQSALSSLRKAVELGPENALAWSRLSELWLSFRDLGKSLDAAKKAVKLNPNIARTQTVLGFAYLTQVKTTESKEAFTKAIELDQADPLPRLGLGLAKIRDGNLKEGRRDIEIAASLDPNNSLIRSYLGKAYYEEKRTDLDVREYEIAKELDPNDPTPWFYGAIAKQTMNQPVEALHDLQKAIELNDNRAIYRSKLALDSDLAARSASIARIYNNLGFQQRGLFEGWMSVNTDPTNYSAHRFLADTYAALPRHEIARVSELLQSQLLQPNNITPIQPRLAESNLFLISSEGPAELSFNEFNTLFNRDRLALQASGVGGENDTWSGEGVVSGIYKRASFSVGGIHFETDGWRENADQDDDIINAFVQLELSHKTSIQAEYRYRDNERGDTQLRFFKDDFLSNLRQDLETNTARLGFRHTFAPGSDLIGNFQYQDSDGGYRDEHEPIFSVDSTTGADAYGGELQYLFRSSTVSLVSGGGYFNVDADDKISYVLNLPFQTKTDIQKSETEIDHGNLYLYSYINFPKNVTWTIGASCDFLDSDREERPDEDQFNPKFGVTWNPFPDTTLRGAVFRTFRRTLITEQTIEPTQVAGFNQFFDDTFGTDAWRYGVAIDQKFSESIYGGAEYTYRDLEVPRKLMDVTTGTTVREEIDWEEKIARVYLFWTPHKWLSLSAQYLYERFERDERFADGAKDVKTRYFPLGINFFHPSGLSASLKGTYIDQEGSFERQGDDLGTFEDGEDNFWLFDAAINYRLPKRYGFITVGISNLFDEKFQYFDTDRDNPHIQPDRFFFAKLTLAIP